MIYFDLVNNVLTLDDISFHFNIESEMKLQLKVKNEQIKLNGLKTLRTDVFESLLNLDLEVLKSVLEVSLVKNENSVKIDFEEFYMEWIKNNQIHVNELQSNVYLLYAGSFELLGFPILKERGLVIIMEKQVSKPLSIIQTSKHCLSPLIQLELEQHLKNFLG